MKNDMVQYDKVARNLFSLIDKVAIDRSDRYIVSYYYLAPGPAQISNPDAVLDLSTFYRMVHMAYGWMPRIVTIYNEVCDLKTFLSEIEEDQRSPYDTLDRDQIDTLSQLIDNSKSGMSKFLHFWQPDKYPIWDRKVETYLRNLIGVEAFPGHYLDYVDFIRAIHNHASFPLFHNRVIEKLGYWVTGVRAAELVMFLAVKQGFIGGRNA